ncbi:MAG: sigma-70 family RNA polymerase sigma factor [Romboutsia sp.]
MKSEEFKGLEVDMQKAKNGSMEAKERIIERYKNFVYKEALKIRIPNLDMEDIIQIGTFTILKSINIFDQNKNKNFTSYVTRAIKNNYLDMLLREQRKHGKNTSDECLSEMPDNANTEESVLMSIDAAKIHGAFKHLNKADAELISELYFHGTTIKEMAKNLNVSYTTVYRRKNKALNMLMTSLGSEISV